MYREEYATFETSHLYDHADATGFIRLFALPYRLAGHARVEAAAGAEPLPGDRMIGGDWLD
jgi:argininosuccinate synthase